jgi:hypothetical protein
VPAKHHRTLAWHALHHGGCTGRPRSARCSAPRSSVPAATRSTASACASARVTPSHTPTLLLQAALGKMQRPAFIFDGRNLLDHEHLRQLGFIVYALGKPLDPFILGN